MFQVVIFHHCSHGTVFRSRDLNILVGRLISTILLFKHFDAYKDGHMLHHSNSKLLTEEDEFADFVFGMCGLEAASPKHVLWRRIALSLVSPMFHARFLLRRIRGAWCSPDWAHNGLGIAVWAIAAIIAAAAGKLVWFLAAWVLPVTVLLQIATVFRIICEHRFPSPEVMANRNRDFACHATAGVFAGVAPPSPVASRLGATLRWAGWWAEMLTLHLFVRLFVLVGDAPCHDYHHRRPASRKWTSYIQARQLDVDSGSPGFGADYSEVWGLFAAVDANLATLARTPREALGITP